MPELRAPDLPAADEPDLYASRFVRVLVADDQSVVPAGCRPRLEAEPHVVVVGETSRPTELLDLVRRVVPRVVVIATGPDETTIDLVHATCQAARSADVVVVTSRRDESYVRASLVAGARGYVGDDDPAVGRAVRAVAGGGAYFSPDVAAMLRDGFLRNGGVPIDGLLRRFSDLERAVLRGLLAGLTSDDLADGLHHPTDVIQRCRNRIAGLLGDND